jgi:hypothetical protein
MAILRLRAGRELYYTAGDGEELIVGHGVTQETNDKQQLMPMITTIEQQSGDTPSQLLADAGYCSDINLAAIADTDIDAYISTRKQKHGERPGPCPHGPLPKTATIVDRMSRKLHTKTGAAVYAARKGIVEPVIGQIKQARLPAILVAGIREGARGMVAGVHDAQHSQVVSPLHVNSESSSLCPARSWVRTPTPPSPKAATDRAARSRKVARSDVSASTSVRVIRADRASNAVLTRRGCR